MWIYMNDYVDILLDALIYFLHFFFFCVLMKLEAFQCLEYSAQLQLTALGHHQAEHALCLWKRQICHEVFTPWARQSMAPPQEVALEMFCPLVLPKVKLHLSALNWWNVCWKNSSVILWQTLINIEFSSESLLWNMLS